MPTSQNYVSPDCGATSTLPELIEKLQNVQLLIQQVPAGDYALSRSVDELTVNVADCIGRLDLRILDAL